MMHIDGQTGTGNMKIGRALCACSSNLRNGANGAVITSRKGCGCICHKDHVGCVGPVTPTSNREIFDSKTPISMVFLPLLAAETLESSSNCDIPASPSTPKEGVFNPFAPGPDKMALAPLRKRVKESQVVAVRRLDFDDCFDCGDGSLQDMHRENGSNSENLSDEMLQELLYEAFLEAIVAKQTQSFLAENHPFYSNGYETPTSLPRLTGVADTCPPAPIRPASNKSWNIDPSLCRKLDF